VAGFDIAVREGNLRISPHLHNSHEDIVKLVGVLST
jgi:selenocysteine lyase/cysteine desulfurase